MGKLRYNYHLEISKDKVGWWLKLKATNKKTIMVSSPYLSKQSVERAASSFAKNLNLTSVEVRNLATGETYHLDWRFTVKVFINNEGFSTEMIH